MRSTVIGCAGAAILLLGAAPVPDLSAQAAPFPLSLEMRVPKSPSIGHANDSSFLAYELHLTNMGALPLTLKRVEVLTIDATPRVLLSVADTALANSIARPGTTIPLSERPALSGGSRAVVYLWVALPGGAAPTELRNRVVAVRGAGDSASVIELEGPVVGNSPLGSEGIPYGMDPFELIGFCTSFTSCTMSAPSLKRGEIPLANELVRFPTPRSVSR